MTMTLRALAASAVVLSVTAAATAQAPLPNALRGTTPGSGLASVDLTGAAPAAPAAPAPGTGLAAPQPAECLCEPAAGPWMVVAPYGWMLGMQGMVGVGERAAPVNVTVPDAIDKLKDLRGAAQLHVESGYGAFGVIADLTYLRLDTGAGPVSVDSRSTLFELLGMYRVVDSGRGAGAVTFDLLAGGRFYRFKNDISGSAFGFVSAERTATWIDLVVGARAGVQVTDALGVFARGDIGGFGIGHGSEQATNVVVGFEYRCCECASFLGGYRWLNIDRESGLGRDRFALDATLSGPFAAFALQY